jgi:hypothetical protein
MPIPASAKADFFLSMLHPLYVYTGRKSHSGATFRHMAFPDHTD